MSHVNTNSQTRYRASSSSTTTSLSSPSPHTFHSHNHHRRRRPDVKEPLATRIKPSILLSQSQHKPQSPGSVYRSNHPKRKSRYTGLDGLFDKEYLNGFKRQLQSFSKGRQSQYFSRGCGRAVGNEYDINVLKPKLFLPSERRKPHLRKIEISSSADKVLKWFDSVESISSETHELKEKECQRQECQTSLVPAECSEILIQLAEENMLLRKRLTELETKIATSPSSVDSRDQTSILEKKIENTPLNDTLDDDPLMNFNYSSQLPFGSPLF